MKKKEVLKKAAALGMTLCVTLSYSGIAMAVPGPHHEPGNNHPPVVEEPQHPGSPHGEKPEDKGPKAEKPDVQSGKEKKDHKAEASKQEEPKAEEVKIEEPAQEQAQSGETSEKKENGEQSNHDETKTPHIVVSGSVPTMTVGDTAKITASVADNPNSGNGGENQIKWTVSSSDESVLIATIDKGVVTVTAVGEGSANIEIGAYTNGNGTDNGSVGKGHVAFNIKETVNGIEVNAKSVDNSETSAVETSAPVYVYAKIMGNYSAEGLKKLGINKTTKYADTWFSIGSAAEVSGLKAPKAQDEFVKITDEQKAEIFDELVRFDKNAAFDLTKVTFGNSLKTESGANDFSGSGLTYHYDGEITFYQVEYKTGYGDNETVKTVDTLMAGMDTPVCEAPERDGYVFAGWGDVSETVTGNATYEAQWVAEDQAIYVYVKVVGNPDADTLASMGLVKSNKHGYYTLGTAAYNGVETAAKKNLKDKVEVSAAERNAILATLTKTHNEGFTALDLVTWEDIKVCDGADSMPGEAPFVPNGTNAYHLDGTIEFTTYDVVYYWMNENQEEVILNTSEAITGVVGQEVTVTPAEKLIVKEENGQKVITLLSLDKAPAGTYTPDVEGAITKKLEKIGNTIKIPCIKLAETSVETPAEPGATTPDNGGNTGGNDTPTVNPEGSEPAAPVEPAEDEITGDAPGSEALGAGGDVIDSDAMGNPDPIDADDAEEDIAATPKGVKTGDETAPWAMGFAGAIIALGGAVALRRREEE